MESASGAREQRLEHVVDEDEQVEGAGRPFVLIALDEGNVLAAVEEARLIPRTTCILAMSRFMQKTVTKSEGAGRRRRPRPLLG